MSDVQDFRPTCFSCAIEGSRARVTFPQSQLTEEDNVERLGEELFSLIEQFHMNEVVIDFTSVQFVTSSVLGKLITLHRKATRFQGQVRLTGIRGELEQILRNSHLLNYFHVELAGNAV